MNYFVYSYTNKNGENKELRLRLTSGDAIEIENTKKKSILEVLGEESLTSIFFCSTLFKWDNDVPSTSANFS